ncbi:Haemolysin XhlA [Mycobacterium tuberculosis]|nr:Haemolysin XhlA [Mycobacterium tuberculosis]
MAENDVGRVLVDIRERLVRVETKIDDMRDVRETAETAEKTANEALQSAKSAHHRLDEVNDNQKWLWRTVLGAVIAGVVSFFMKLKG